MCVLCLCPHPNISGTHHYRKFDNLALRANLLHPPPLIRTGLEGPLPWAAMHQQPSADEVRHGHQVSNPRGGGGGRPQLVLMRPPPICSVGPNFSHHKARVQAVGWFPLGTRKQGSRPFAAPTPPPPQQKWGRTESRPSTPPPPACLRTLTAGRHMVIEVPEGADAERRV